MVGRYRKGKYDLYILKKENIETEAENILRVYSPECLNQPKAIDIERLIEDMGIVLSYARMSKNSETLGAFVFNKGKIQIYEEEKTKYRIYDEKTIIIDTIIAEKNDPRLNFTYGHELGHYVTQFDALHINSNQISLFDSDLEKENAVICKRDTVVYSNLFNERKKLETKEDWQEWQANYFSTCILIPKCTLRMALKPYIDRYDVMDQDKLLNKLSFNELELLIDKLASIYNVSSEMMINRLKSLNYLN